MAERRMFTKKITEADQFTELPPTAQALYFHLCMSADDDGFSNEIRKAMFNAHASTTDFNVLVAARFIIPFDSGVIVIKHWKMHNYIRNDRYNSTAYVEEKAMLVLKENGVYTEKEKLSDTNGIPTVYQLDTQVRLGKDRLGKDSIEPQRAPAREEVQAYCKERGYSFSPDEFFDAYDATNWRIKGEPIYDWKAVAAAWDRKEKEKHKPKYNRAVNGYDQSPIRESDIEGMIVNFD